MWLLTGDVFLLNFRYLNCYWHFVPWMVCEAWCASFLCNPRQSKKSSVVGDNGLGRRARILFWLQCSGARSQFSQPRTRPCWPLISWKKFLRWVITGTGKNNTCVCPNPFSACKSNGKESTGHFMKTDCQPLQIMAVVHIKRRNHFGGTEIPASVWNSTVLHCFKPSARKLFEVPSLSLKWSPYILCVLFSSDQKNKINLQEIMIQEPKMNMSRFVDGVLPMLNDTLNSPCDTGHSHLKQQCLKDVRALKLLDGSYYRCLFLWKFATRLIFHPWGRRTQESVTFEKDLWDSIFKPRALPERRLAKAAYLSHHAIIIISIIGVDTI